MTTSTIRKFAVGVASVALVASAAAPAFAADLTANRLAGDTRYETAYEVALHEFPNGGSVAYVARGDNLVDAITAGQLTEGPLFLLNDDAELQGKIKTYLSKQGVGKVVAIGGEKAISDDTIKAVLPSGMNYERVAGEDRYETAAKIAARAAGLSSSKPVADKDVPVYLANGQSMVDALTGGQLVGYNKGVILLTDGTDNLPKATAQALNKQFYNSDITALGGVKAVSDAALTAANVAKVILADSYIEDFQAEIKAAAEALNKVEGYYTISAKADKATVLGKITDSIDKAKAASTYPRIATTIVEKYAGLNSGKFFVPTNADDGTVDTTQAEPSLIGKAKQYKSDKLEDGQATINYMGTTKALNAAITANNKYLQNAASLLGVSGWAAEVEVSSGFLADNSSDPNSSTTIPSGLETELKNRVPEFKYVAPGATTGTAWAQTNTLEQLAAALNITLPAYDAAAGGAAAGATNVTWLKKDNGAARTRANLAATIESRLAAMESVYRNSLATAVTTATTADSDAQKALKLADKALKDRIEKRYPGYILNRIAGADRYATSVEIAKEIYASDGTGATQYLYFANGEAFADAAVSGMIDSSAPSKRGPVLLTKRDEVPSSVMSYAKTLDKYADYRRNNVFAIGGPVVISDANLQNILDTLTSEGTSMTVSFTGPEVTYADSVAKVVYDGKTATVTVTPRVSNAAGNVVTVWQYFDATTNTWVDLVKDYATGATPAGWPAGTALTITPGTGGAKDNLPSDKQSTLLITAKSGNAAKTVTQTVKVRAYTTITNGTTGTVLLEKASDTYLVEVSNAASDPS